MAETTPAAGAPDHAALHAAPDTPVGAGWTSTLSLATLAALMAFMTPLQILLPLQLERIDPHGKTTALAVVTGLGALVPVVANPIAGALSDRTTSRLGAAGRGSSAAPSPAPRPALDARSFVGSFWVSPRRYPDFGWAWLTRFLINLGNALGTLYLFYFLADAVHHDDPGTGVLVLTVVYTLCAALTAIPVGALSDRIGRRKGFVVLCSPVMAAAALLLALLHTWPAALAAAGASAPVSASTSQSTRPW
ncbi:MFS transporter [Streptomyces sp. NPDC006879]|uniref:MFS transporter n=1 Tax=Streptomyces sp. NPDC006879 TaxID=3364767 RepID=UPI0036BA4D3E